MVLLFYFTLDNLIKRFVLSCRGYEPLVKSLNIPVDIYSNHRETSAKLICLKSKFKRRKGNKRPSVNKWPLTVSLSIYLSEGGGGGGKEGRKEGELLTYDRQDLSAHV